MKRNWVEWIVIDGGSIDGTVDVISKNAGLIDKWIIEEDRGIYDAWNKGIGIAAGEYIAFLGADDFLDESYFDIAENEIKGSIYNIIAFKIVVLHNEHEIVYLNTLPYTLPRSFPLDLGFHHQGTLHHRELFLGRRFDVSYKVLGDMEFLTRVSNLLKPKICVTERPLVFSRIGGVSNKPSTLLPRYIEKIKVLRGVKEKYFESRAQIIMYGAKYIFRYIILLLSRN